MIKPITFAGKVYLTGSTERLAKKPEVEQMKAYADKNNCDVVVLDRDYYVDGTGKYETILVQEEDESGRNFYAQKTFDFSPRKQGTINNVPAFRYLPKIKLN